MRSFAPVAAVRLSQASRIISRVVLTYAANRPSSSLTMLFAASPLPLQPEGNSFADVMKSFDAMRGVIDDKYQEAKSIEEGKKPQ